VFYKSLPVISERREKATKLIVVFSVTDSICLA
jgi:hypothetical protein